LRMTVDNESIVCEQLAGIPASEHEIRIQRTKKEKFL